MAERSKELLQLEHKESTLLVCDGKRESNPKTKTLPRNGTPLTAPVQPSQLLGKVKDFLGVMSEANKRLELDAKDHPENYNIEELTGNETKVIEMDLMLGVADLHTPEAVAAAESAITSGQHVISLAADGSEMDSEASSADDDSGDDETESNDEKCDDGNNGEKPFSHVQKSFPGNDDITEKHKGNRNSRKHSRIVELS
ncbi:uncharacterized protein LOC130721868 isoform X2 [Lotus japonicus]|uniref:uncharacterized protein LOC130721868 isoform X2 n=1 Tax=Lotus japonicus TaxID=34305 RepID=UPI0025886AF0|nr:uncharacterized protein LOC130721868 isoform X2 [Lotus japonicus]